MSLILPRGWWGYHWSPPHPRSVIELILARTLDPELAALLWLLVEGRVPLIVAAGPPLAGKSTTLTALLDFLPSTTRAQVLRGSNETFGWLPEAPELGWAPAAHSHAETAADPATTYLLASELSGHLPIYTWGAQARTAVRATSRGYGLGATIHADSLAEVFAELQAPPVSLTEDELRNLGVVLVLRMLAADGSVLDPLTGTTAIEIAPFEPGVRRRIVAAHYVRPLERDAGGHVQRRPPAVLATWNAAGDAYDHFSWGLTSELAMRVGRTPQDFERQLSLRADFLRDLARNGVRALDDVAAAIAQYATGNTVPPRPDSPRGFRPEAMGPLAFPPEPS